MADERTSQTPLDSIIGEGRDAGPAAESPRGGEQQQQPLQPSVAGEVGIPPPPEREERPGTWAYSALKDERGKRQALAERNAELEARLQSYETHLRQQQEQQQQPQIPDVIVDPEGYHRHVEEHVAGKLRNLEANFSFRLAHDKHGDDFERAWSSMVGLAQNGDPSVVKWCMSTPDPGAAMMLWYTGGLQQQQQQRGGPVMPSNFTGARNVGSRRGPQWSGPASLDSIFEMRNKR